MATLPKKESRAPTTRLGLDTNYGDGLERQRSRKPDQKLPEHYGVGDPTGTFSSASSHLSSRGRISKWFWDSAEEGYRTYHMDEYDEDKNPNVSEPSFPLDCRAGIPYLDPTLTQGSIQLAPARLDLRSSDPKRASDVA